MRKKDKPRKPKGVASVASATLLILYSSVALLLAVGVAVYWHQLSPADSAAAPPAYAETERMAAHSEGDEAGGPAAAACTAVQTLWDAPSSDGQLGCTGFLARHWERLLFYSFACPTLRPRSRVHSLWAISSAEQQHCLSTLSSLALASWPRGLRSPLRSPG